jgi:Bacterial Ig domain
MNKKGYLVITVIAVATVLILASSCTTPTNQEPIVTSLEAEAGWTTPSGSLQVTCTASDPDGDELSYNWSASAGEVNGDGDTAMWTAPASEGSYSVAVVVTDGRGGEVMDYVAITVRINNPPTIASLTAGAEWTTPSGSIQATCTASDPDGDELSYDWTATAGDISGTGAVVNWIAPQAVGTYNITVVVTDGYGSSATKTLLLNVVTGQPPNIEALNITAEHCYLKPSPSGYYVGKEQEYNIECIVVHTGVKLFYHWSCTGGVISGGGSLITWTAPNESVDVTVTVVVSDISGSMGSKNMTLSVVPCSYCMFGC